MLILKAFHIIAMVAWFAGLFYLPRLFVYHAQATDPLSLSRFQTMERRLYYGIMWPSGVLTTVLGLALLSYAWPYYLQAGWMHAKLLLVGLLWVFHGACGHYRRIFILSTTVHSPGFYRIFNEVPTLFLISIVLLVVIKPF